MGHDKLTNWVAVLLCASGLVHLGLWMAAGQEWEGPISLRKPALFGISSGLTLWSLGWVLSCIPSHTWERLAGRFVALALLGEVGLITMQYWRGVPSHFNHATSMDRWIEAVMLMLILLVTLWIAWLSLRAQRSLTQPPAMARATRAGMWLLLLSCGLGIMTTVLGQWNLNHGKPYEVWGQAGVLKFPHGIALHAIQLLPLCAWLLQWLRVSSAERVIQGLIAAQWFLVLYALKQTLQGRSRVDMDAWSLLLLVAAVAWIVWPLLSIRRASVSRA